MTTLIQAYQIQADIHTSVETQQPYHQPHFDCDPRTTTSKPNGSYQREIDALNQQLLDLQAKNDVLEAEKDELVSQVSDLRLLLKRVSKESENNLKKLEEKQRLLETRCQGLESALESSYENSSHFEQLRLFWQDME